MRDWFVYALAEAARLWNQPGYARDARMLLVAIESQEVSEVPEFGTMLLPGAAGFMRTGAALAVQPKLPAHARAAAAGCTVAPGAMEPDCGQSMPATWLGNARPAPTDWRPTGLPTPWIPRAPGLSPRTRKRAAGSYDAIRTYLWAGMTPRNDPLRRP